ncbi:MAG: hypothetical protein ACE5HI_07600 [bacterium]
MIRRLVQIICVSLFLIAAHGSALWAPVIGGRILPAKMGLTESGTIDSLLMRISLATEKVSYSGVQRRMVRHRGKPLELRWQEYHWHPDRTVVIFLAPDDLRNSKLVLQGEQLRYRGDRHFEKRIRYGGTKDLLLKNGQLFKEIALLHRNYRVQATRIQPFLERPTILLNVSPQHQNRPALNALVDEKSGLLLQVNRRPIGSSTDSLVVMNQFLNISYETPDTTIFLRAWSETKPLKKRRQAKVYSDLATLMTSYDGEVLIPQKVPVGFALLQIKSFQRREKSFIHFLYSDGLTFISLFQRKGDHEKDDKKERKGRSKSKSPFAIIRGSQGGLSYSIAGEVPRAELVEMADSLVPIIRKNINPKWKTMLPYLSVVLFVIILFYMLRRREKSYA